MRLRFKWGSQMQHNEIVTDKCSAAGPLQIDYAMLARLIVGLLAIAAIGYVWHDGVPVLLTASVVYAMPKSRPWCVRLGLALIAALVALFVLRMWPSVMAASNVSESASDSCLLSCLIAIPLIAAAVILVVPRSAEKAMRVVTMVTMLALFGLSARLLVPMGRGFHFNQDIVWLARFGIHYHVALDGISLWLVLLTTFTLPIAAYASFGSIHTRIKEWCFSLLLLEAALIGAFVAIDLFLFYVFWELMLIPMYIMIGVWGGSDRIRAAIKFFLYTMFGSVLMLAAILYLAYMYSKLNGTPSFDYFELQRVMLPRNVQIWLWGAFTLSFIIKVPMFPVHTWLPDAHTEAPTAGSVILAAVMLKLGTYGYLRFSMGLFPEASAEFAAVLAGMAVVGGILYGALCAWRQGDVKRLVAYSSVAHLGYVMLGLFAATPASLEGAVLQMVNHGISTGALFLLVGVIYDRRHTRQLSEFGGLAKVMPVYATLFIIATVASIGLPGTNGFIGEFMVITGTYVSHKLGYFNGIQAAGAAVGVILGALYMLTAVQKMFFGPITHAENKSLQDLNGRELLSLAPLVAMIFVMGVAPGIFIDQIRGATSRTLDVYQSRLAAHPGPRYFEGVPHLIARQADAPIAIGTPSGDGATAEKRD